MTFTPAGYAECHVLHRDVHTCFDDVVALFGNLSAYLYMAHTIQRGRPSIQNPQHPFRMNCMTSNVVYTVFPYDLVHLLARSRWPTEYRIYEDVEIRGGANQGELTGDDHQQFVRTMIGSSFVRYYESQRDDVVDAVGGNIADWPEPWNFARVLRNAFAHNGIWFKNPNAEPVSWRGVTFAPGDNGTHPLFPILGLGDVVGLLLELDEVVRNV